jgi:hypothetical protein
MDRRMRIVLRGKPTSRRVSAVLKLVFAFLCRRFRAERVRRLMQELEIGGTRSRNYGAHVIGTWRLPDFVVTRLNSAKM